MERDGKGLQRILARNVKMAREKLGYSQMELAEQADLSTTHMTDLEQGRKWVSSGSLQRLADALGLEPFMLLLPPDYSSELDAFSLLAEYASSVRERIEGALDTSLKDIMQRRRREQ